jgi:hypothetical protein
MYMQPFHCLLGCLLLVALNATAQRTASTVAKTTEFSIPTSPAFDLLAVNPSQISRPNNIRDFKVDWSFRSWRLKPNIAIQAQPVWEAVYNRPDLSRYRKASPLMKTLSTLDVSAGTIEDDVQNRRASLAVKMNLYRQHDPLRDMKLFVGIDTAFAKRSDAQHAELQRLKHQRRQPGIDLLQKTALSVKIDSMRQLIDIDAKAQKERIQAVANTYVASYWNAAHLDVAWGKVFSYQNASLDSLSLRGRATAIWVNGSVGVGKKILLTGVVKYLMQERIDSLNTQGNLFTGGVGVRYGTPKFNFFTEVLYASADAPQGLAAPGLNLIQVERLSVTYGGDWRINHNVLLSYGVRVDYAIGFKFKNILPVAGVSCMMR